MISEKDFVFLVLGRHFIKSDIPQLLEHWGISYKSYDHESVYTVEESRSITGHIPGGHTKNLFLRDKKHQHWLITALDDSFIDIKSLKKHLSAKGSLTFVDGDVLYEKLGVKPGSVSPLAMLNDRKSEVKVVLDLALLEYEMVNVHPLSNDSTISISPLDLFRIFSFCRSDVTFLDFSRSLENA